MRRIAIIGAGQAGLLTAHGLLKEGHDVTLYSDRTPEQWLNESRPTGTAGRFAPTLDYERELGLNHWEKEIKFFEGVYLVFSMQPTVPFITLAGRFERGGAAIDLRLQSHRWMHDLVERGGKLVIETVDMARLDAISAQHDLTIVASGKGGIAELFQRNEQRSVYKEPQRNLAMMIVKNTGDVKGIPYNPVKFNLLADYGETFWVPYYHKTLGHTWNIIVEAKPGTPLDKFMNAKNGHEVVSTTKQIIKDFFPWDYDWVKNAELADENGWLVGKLTPTVRDAVGCLPSGRVVTGVGDTLMTFDPIAGQGANNGSRMAQHLVASIIKRGNQSFDAEWIAATFEDFYQESGKVTFDFNNILLEPISDAGKELLIAQYGSNGRTDNRNGKQAIANAFCANFADPHHITHLFNDMQQARQFITEKMGTSWLRPAATGRFAVIRDQIRQKIGMNPNVGYW